MKTEQNIKNLVVKHLSKKDLKLINTCGECGSENIHFYVDGEGFQQKECTNCTNNGWFDVWYDNFPTCLSGFMNGSFDSEVLVSYCPYCKSYGELRKKQTHVNGWSACCKKCYDFFGNPALMNFDENASKSLESESRDMVHRIITGRSLGFNQCCIDYYLALNCINGIHAKIPEYHYKSASKTGFIKCPECMIEEMGGID